MDTGNDGKSLPGGGMPFSKWMRKTTERYEYSDILCQSPPTDGFFQMKRQNINQKPGQNISETAECMKNQIRQEQFSTLTVGKPNYSKTICEMEKASGIGGTSIQLHRQVSNKESSILPEPTNMFKTVSNSTTLQSSTTSNKTITSTNATTSIATTEPQKQSIISNAIKENPSIYNKNDSTQGQNVEKAAAGDKTLATRPNIPPVIITKPEETTGNLMGYVESKFDNFKMWQDKSKSAPCSPTATPCSTPQITPASSPQMGRKSGNPFFTPSSSASGSVSWLFRPPQADTGYSSDRETDSNRDILYETKYNVNPATNCVKKSYVPRPSKLRELNFWSPTTM